MRRLGAAILLLLSLSACQAAAGLTQAPTKTPGTTATPVAAQPPTKTIQPAITPTTLPTPSVTMPPGDFKNPVLDHDFPDPDVIQVGEWFYAYATNSEGVHVQAARSTDLAHWEMLADALPRLPAWAVQEFGWTWAPDVSAGPDGKGYILFYVTRLPLDHGGIQCIASATAQHPEGPFSPRGDAPLVCQRDEGGSIDPSVFIDQDGNRYLLWKNDGNSVGGTTYIYIQPLAANGLDLTGQPTRLIHQDQSWEGRLVEAPTLFLHDHTYTLFYSANDFNSPNYAIGYAQSAALLGPYKKSPDPLLQFNMQNGFVGPGGQDVVHLKNGSDWLVFHSWSPKGYRFMDIDPLVWKNGMPEVKDSGRKPQPLPVVK